jgi:sugar O-acyltransferase (sialic acid O-acetyltransferase NeuD family)
VREIPDVIIFGIGPISKTIFYSNKKNEKYKISCFTADQKYIKEKTLCGVPIVPFEKIETHYPPKTYDMLVVNVGSVAGTMSRKDMFLRAKKKGYHLTNYIDDNAHVVQDVTLGQNNIIMGNTHIGPTGIMGDNNFIRENIYLGHDFNVGNHNFLGPGCNIGGSVQIGNLNFIGMGTTVINNIEIKDENLVGAGSLVIRNIESCGKYMGHPVKRITDHIQTEKGVTDG